MTEKKKKDQTTDADFFAKKTFKEVTLWDWLGRILPLTVLSIIVVCYFFKWNTALELVLEIATIVFFIFSFIWWYWAIYKIAVTVKYVQTSQEKFRQVLLELRKFKKEVNNDSSNGQRGKPEESNKH